MSLCAQDNMTVAMPSTPASYFHLLRWHALSERIKPLVVFTPKSMLRLKAAVSAVADFTGGAFQPVLTDPGVADPAQVRRVLLCTGKIYYDLAERRRELNRGDVAVVRVERLYPLPVPEIAGALATYPDATELIWVQDEPVNMGAWPYMAMHLPGALGRGLGVIALPESSAPAQGSAKAHAAEHAALVASAFG
jgi:2-oxoglutarate dehydrogenase E1 component